MCSYKSVSRWKSKPGRRAESYQAKLGPRATPWWPVTGGSGPHRPERRAQEPCWRIREKNSRQKAIQRVSAPPPTHGSFGDPHPSRHLWHWTEEWSPTLGEQKQTRASEVKIKPPHWWGEASPVWPAPEIRRKWNTPFQNLKHTPRLTWNTAGQTTTTLLMCL